MDFNRTWRVGALTAAVVMTAAGIATASTTTGGHAATEFHPVAPCRLLDSRDDGTIGRLGADSTEELDAVGRCGIPAEATALSVNISAVDATERTFLVIYPAGDERPTASLLNPGAHEPVTSNAATITLAGDGAIEIYNRAGSVDVVIDVLGWYAPSSPTEIAHGAPRLVDGDENVLGTVVYLDRYMVTVLTSTGHLVELDWDGTVNDATLFYSEAGCSGDAFTYGRAESDPIAPNFVVYAPGTDSLMVGAGAAADGLVHVSSFSQQSSSSPSGVCSDGAQASHGFALSPATPASVGLPAYPLATPLVVRS